MNVHSQNFHHFVAQSLQPFTIVQSGLSDADLKKAIFFLQQQSSQLSADISFEMLRSGTEEHRKQWLSDLQQQLVFQSDMVCKYLVHDQKTWIGHCNAAEIRSLYLHTLDTFEDLIAFFQDKFSAYVNWEIKYTDSMLKAVLPEMRHKVSSLKKLMEANGIDPELVSIVSSGLNWLLRSVSFSPLNKAYLLKLHNAVHNIRVLNDESLVAVLIACDFNDPELYHHQMVMLEASLINMAGLHDQRVRVLQEKHITAMIKPLDKIRLYSKQPSLKQEVITAISEKEAYLTNLLELTRQELSDSELAGSVFRIVTEMPGPQVAIFLRMMMETGTWMKYGITDLAKFFCRYFTDPQGNFLAFDNLVRRSTEVQFTSALKLWEVTEVWRNWLDNKYQIRNYQRSHTL